MRLPQPQPDWPQSWRDIAFYDRIELVGDRRHLGSYYAYQNRLHLVLDTVRNLAAPGARVLDVAAAQGNFTLALAEAGYRMTWNDLRPDTIGYVKLKWQSGEIEYRPGDIFATDLGTPFDVVMALEVIVHVAHPDRLLARLAALARPGGYVVITTPNGHHWRNHLPRFSDHPDPAVFESGQFKPDADGHIFLLHGDEFSALGARASLRLVRYETFNSFLSCGWVGTNGLLRFLPAGLVIALERLARRLPWRLRRGLTCTALAVFAVPDRKDAP